MNSDTAEQPRWSLEVKHLRGLRDISWAPEGVSLLVGPNGSGKTTLLKSLEFLRNLYEIGARRAIEGLGGAQGQRNLHTTAGSPISFRLHLDALDWRLSFATPNAHMSTAPGEALYEDNELIASIEPLERSYTTKTEQVPINDGRCVLRHLEDRDSSEALKPLTQFIGNIRSFKHSSPHNADLSVAEDWGTRELRADGRNLLHVLATWRGAPRTYGDRFAWVERKLKEAFPELIDGLDLELLPSATVHATFYPPQAASTDAKLPLRFAADGLKVMLHHLTAVAGAEPGAVIAIDEVENHLHPFAIRKLIEAMREIAEERELTILLTTHSPVLLDAFRECPEQVWVLEENGVGPRRLDQLFEPDWLAHFSLGQLYDRLKFGAPHPAPPPEDADARSVDPDR